MKTVLGILGFSALFAAYQVDFSSSTPEKGVLEVGAITEPNFDLASLSDFEAYKAAIVMIESRGNYRAASRVNGNGQRAWGIYQILGSNIPRWTQEVLGRRMTIEEFLDNHEAQDIVFEKKTFENFSRYGNWADCASMWLSGRPAKGNFAKDGNGTSVPKYVGFVLSYMRAHGNGDSAMPRDSAIPPIKLPTRDQLTPEYDDSHTELGPPRLAQSEVSSELSKESLRTLTVHLKDLPCHPPDLSGCGIGSTYVLSNGTIGLVEPHPPDKFIPVIHPGLSLFRKP
jgi:hypothetical protein